MFLAFARKRERVRLEGLERKLGVEGIKSRLAFELIHLLGKCLHPQVYRGRQGSKLGVVVAQEMK